MKDELVVPVQELPLNKIKVDPDQPRKTISEESLKELSASILELGVIQPITVRESGKGFMIIVGERRFRASKLAKLKTIPCMVRNLDIDVIREIQLVENLQRKDVEPIEEAEAIAALSEKYTAAEIATKIGRTERFIYGRLKLVNLIEGFRVFVTSKEMTISQAIGTALLTEKEQLQILEGMGEKFSSNYISRSIQEQTFNLKNAPFDIKDPKIVPDAGACVKCPFNSINTGSLFGDDKQICSRSSCYSLKKQKGFLNLIEQTKKDGRILIPKIASYNLESSENTLVRTILSENGFELHLTDDVDILTEPEKPTMESVKKANHWRDYTEEEWKEELKEELEEYKEFQEEYKTALENGYVKGVLFDTNTYLHDDVFIRFYSAVTQTIGEVPLKKKKMDDCTPSEKIDKMNAREIRKKEIEANKEFKQIVETMSKADYINSKKALTQDEMTAFCISLHQDHIGWSDEFKGYDKLYGKRGNVAKMVATFRKNYNKTIFNKLVRYMLLKNVHTGEIGYNLLATHHNNLPNNAIFTAVKPFCKKEVEEIEEAFSTDTLKREKRLKERISKLEEELSALKSA